ncbi:MAG: hypothetical protein NZL88_09170 [Gaiellaceae bacterium]|nr:hypothetical protein [Gaiellaceae bacterium]
MRAAVLLSTARSSRLLADLAALPAVRDEPGGAKQPTPALERLEAAIGPDLADRLLAALASDRR